MVIAVIVSGVWVGGAVYPNSLQCHVGLLSKAGGNTGEMARAFSSGMMGAFAKTCGLCMAGEFHKVS